MPLPLRLLPLTLSLVLAGACTRLRDTGHRPDTAGANGKAPRYGELMSEVGRRFERAGHAAEAGRWELAGYDLSELDEIFQEELPTAAPPRVLLNDIKGLMQSFVSQHPAALRRAAAAHDRAAFAAAFAAAAAACNACHQASGHAFLEVPASPGATVPRLDRPVGDGGSGQGATIPDGVDARAR